jgi:outer membrane cobalamin receptor
MPHQRHAAGAKTPQGDCMALAYLLVLSTLTISGSITDTSGGALASATVEVVVAGRAIATTNTGADGRYQLQAPSGVPFQLRVRRIGFAEQAVAIAGSTQPVERDITLLIGGVSDTLVVTASGDAEARATVSAATTVLAEAEIRRLGATSLADVMRFVPGLAVEGTGRESGRTSLFSRGGESDYNLVLIDGVRVNEGGGGFDVSRIAAGEIERVEVVRGAQSALWGSDAMGAVVQVFTRRGRSGGPSVSGSLEGGSFATWRSDIQLSGATSRVDYHVGAIHRQTDGAFADRLRQRDRFEHFAVDGSLGLALGTRATVRTGVRYSNAQGRVVGNIAYGANDSGTAYDSTDLAWHVAVGHAIGARYAGVATVNDFHTELTSADTVADPSFNVYVLLEGRPGAVFPRSPRLVRLLTQQEFLAAEAGGGLGAAQFLATTPFGVSDFASSSRSTFRRPAFRYQGDISWPLGQRTTVGYEYENERNPLEPVFRLDNNAVFAQHQIATRDRWFVTAGVRVDRKSSYDTFVSPKLSVGALLLPYRSGGVSSVKVFFNAGKGIKTPTFSERFGGSFADGNADLAVERARSTDAGIEVTAIDQRVRVLVAAFHNRFRDQVEFLSSSPSFSLDGQPDFINIAGSRARGIEIEAAVIRPAAGLTAAATYALVATNVEQTVQTDVQFQPGQPLLRRPKHSGSLRLSYALGRLSINANARFIGQRHDSAFLSLRSVPNPNFPQAVDTDITVNPGYAVWGFGADVRVHSALTVFARGDNVGGSVYETALGYPGLPRAVVAGARFSLGGR